MSLTAADILASVAKLPTKKQQVEALMAYLPSAHKYNKLATYKPFGKQLEFHAHGKDKQERALFAGSQFGKTLSAGMEMAMHLTGVYPDWWPGRRFNRPIKAYVVSESMQFSRDNAQRIMFGEIGNWGTGTLPALSFAGKTDSGMERIVKAPHSAANTIDTVFVRHVNGGDSIAMFKSAEMDRNKLGGDTIDVGWADEEAPLGHYEELVTRTNIRNGIVFTTFTPLKGGTHLVDRFQLESNPQRAYVTWTIDDENPYTREGPQRVLEIKKQYENSPLRDARLYGKPIRGSGNVFHARRDQITVEPFAIPDHWPRICGQDYGWVHPAGLAWWALDQDSGIAYLYEVWRREGALMPDIESTWRHHQGPSAGIWIPVAWPQDGDNETAAGAGVSVADQQRALGMLMLGEAAALPETDREDETKVGRKSVEAQVQLMDQEMLGGRIKVFSTCVLFFEEYDKYYRDENGRIVKKLDDVISAARYGWVMRRYATTKYAARQTASAIQSYTPNWRS